MNQIRRSVEYQLAHVPGSAERLSRLGQQITGVGIGLGALILSSGRIKTALTAPAVPTFISNIVAHPAGPMYVLL